MVGVKVVGANRRDREDARPLQSLAQIRQELERSRVGPLEILEHHDQGAARSHGGEVVCQRVELLVLRFGGTQFERTSKSRKDVEHRPVRPASDF
jgi:hypothetical protein